MARYIIQDAFTGYLWGDTADFAAGKDFDGIVDACRLLDESVDPSAATTREYEEVSRLSGASGYLVYRADINGSDAVPVVYDGQSKEAIEAVETSCELVGYVKTTDRI